MNKDILFYAIFIVTIILCVITLFKLNERTDALNAYWTNITAEECLCSWDITATQPPTYIHPPQPRQLPFKNPPTGDTE